jgi:hypothetical protein
MWGDDLDSRSTEDKRAGDGTRASTIFRQTQLYIAPLLKHFKAKDTPRELIPLLVEIAQYMQQREYVIPPPRTHTQRKTEIWMG